MSDGDSPVSRPLPSSELRVERLIPGAPLPEELRALQRSCFPHSAIDLAEELERPWAELWVGRVLSPDAREASSIVTFVLAWRVADELQILEVGTSPAQRGRGLGRALVQEAVVNAARSGGRLVLLEVRRSNLAAVRLYRGLGFRLWSLRRGYYEDPREDALELALAFGDDGSPSPLEDESACGVDPEELGPLGTLGA